MPDCPSCGEDGLYRAPQPWWLEVRCCACGWASGPIVQGGDDKATAIRRVVGAVLGQEPTRYSRYVCPACGRGTEEMSPLDATHQPSGAELLWRPEVRLVAEERLQCPCGMVHTWFTVAEVVEAKEEGENV